MVVTEQHIIEICNKSVDVSKLTAQNYTLCVDGTSCTKKTSILNTTGRLVSKNQRVNPNQNSDTYFPSMIGYICSGIDNLTCGGPHFEDRSPLNVLDWHILWKVFDDYLKNFGNTEVNEENPIMHEAIDRYKNIFNNYKQSYFYKMFSKDINTIALIDSNIERCDSLRFNRGEASDIERSMWKFYTSLQNLMYKELYPGLYIDLEWFGDADSSDVVSGLAKFLTSVLDKLAMRPNLNHAPIINRVLPVIKDDYTLNNITTHTYRSIGRWGCQQLAGNDEPLKVRIPSYVNVTNIQHPRGSTDMNIFASSREYLFKVDNYDEPVNNSNENEYTIDEIDMFEQ